jgi:TRAP-type C4-dicarboxylate transport system permease small subunit
MPQTSPPLPPRLTAIVEGLAWALAILGCVVLIALVAVTDASIIGRLLIPVGLGPIPGDFEIVEAGTAFAILSFLPLCQFRRGHASVDVFTSRLPPRALRIIGIVVDLVFAVVITLIVWRMYIGLGDKLRNGQTTFILQIPVWWTYAGGLVGGISWLMVSYYCLIESVAALVLGRDRVPAAAEEGY